MMQSTLGNRYREMRGGLPNGLPRRLPHCLALLLLVLPSTLLAEKPPDLEEIVREMGEAQESLKTLSADFTQVKTLSLLAKPDVSKGHLYFNAPGKILWEYLDPDHTLLLIDERTLLAYYPDLKKADRVDISKKRERYDKYFGVTLGATGKGRDYFEIELALESDLPGTWLLILTPKSKRIERYVSEIRLWVDRKNFLPRKFEYREANGDATTYLLESVVTNEPLPADTFAVKLPQDVEVNDLTGLKSRRGKGL